MSMHTHTYSAVFSTEDGVTYSATLSPITLTFTDLFLPLPSSILEKVLKRVGHHLFQAVIFKLLQASSEDVFALLWNHIESVQQ